MLEAYLISHLTVGVMLSSLMWQMNTNEGLPVRENIIDVIMLVLLWSALLLALIIMVRK